jgi:hypothetical protein
MPRTDRAGGRSMRSLAASWLSRPAGDRPSGPEVGLIVVLTVGAALVGWKILEQVRIGAQWDTYALLANAARFAGRGIGFDEAHRPPVLSLLTSLVFRVTPLSVWPIQAIDGLISFSGLPALYLVLRRRVEQVPAAMCALGLLMLQPVWYWLGVGYTDLASVALTIWALLFAIKATEDDPRWYIAAFPMLVIASLTRVTALLGVFTILLWIALRGRPFRQARQLAYGAGAALGVFAPVGVYYANRFGDIFFPYLVYLTMANEQAGRGVTGIGIEPGGWQPLAGMIVLLVGWLAAWGISTRVAQYLKAHRPGGRSLLLVAAAVGVVGAGQVLGGLVARQATLPIGVYLVWRALAPRDEDGEGRVTAISALDAAMFLLLISYLDFHGHQPVKVWRYFITLAPAAMYFVALGWRRLADGLGALIGSWRDGGQARSEGAGLAATWSVLGLVLCGLLASNAFGTLTATPEPIAQEARATAQWIRARESDPSKLMVYSDVWPITSWYLRAEARAMPRFPDQRAFAHELSKRRVDYYVTLGSTRYEPTFAPAFASGGTTVLSRRMADTSSRPSVRYLGKAWENYLETVDDFRLDLFYDGGFEGWSGSVFMDAYPATELEKYNAVAVYRVRWYDRGKAEQTLNEYLADGGTVIFDASGNIGDVEYPVLDTIMFDTFIRRRQVPADAALTVSSGFAARHPGLASRVQNPWVDEGGGAWFGADYAPVAGAPPRETLLSLGGSPVVTVQRMGGGRIYWIGANLVWHAFKNGDSRERALVSAVLDEAVGRPPVAALSETGTATVGETTR